MAAILIGGALAVIVIGALITLSKFPDIGYDFPDDE